MGSCQFFVFAIVLFFFWKDCQLFRRSSPAFSSFSFFSCGRGSGCHDNRRGAIASLCAARHTCTHLATKHVELLLLTRHHLLRVVGSDLHLLRQLGAVGLCRSAGRLLWCGRCLFQAHRIELHLQRSDAHSRRTQFAHFRDARHAHSIRLGVGAVDHEVHARRPRVSPDRP